jgi:hypothetical protein
VDVGSVANILEVNAASISSNYHENLKSVIIDSFTVKSTFFYKRQMLNIKSIIVSVLNELSTMI